MMLWVRRVERDLLLRGDLLVEMVWVEAEVVFVAVAVVDEQIDYKVEILVVAVGVVDTVDIAVVVLAVEV